MITNSMMSFDGEHSAVVEASAIGLAPGSWPLSLVVAPDVGNGKPLRFYRGEVTPEKEVTGVRYRQEKGQLDVLVVND